MPSRSCSLRKTGSGFWAMGNIPGAVDNITLGFNGNSTTYDFEVVPEPSGVDMGLIAVAPADPSRIGDRRSTS